MKVKLNVDLNCGLIRSLVNTSSSYYRYKNFMTNSQSTNDKPKPIGKAMNVLSGTIKYLSGDDSCQDCIPKTVTDYSFAELITTRELFGLDVNEYFRLSDEAHMPFDSLTGKSNKLLHDMMSLRHNLLDSRETKFRPTMWASTPFSFYDQDCPSLGNDGKDVREEMLEQLRRCEGYAYSAGLRGKTLVVQTLLDSLPKTKETQNLFTTDGKPIRLDGGTD